MTTADDGPRGGDSGAYARLSLDRIVRVAIELADAEGLESLSMRRLAIALGSGAMSLYRHVSGKDELLAHMVEAVFGELEYPTRPPSDWRARLEVAARLEWTMYRRHGWVLTAVGTQRPMLGPNVLASIEWMVAALDESELDPDTTLQVYLLVSDYVQGAAKSEADEAVARRRSGQDIAQWWRDRRWTIDEQVATGRYPALARLGLPKVDSKRGKDFEFGLQRILDGLEPLLGGTDAAPTPRTGTWSGSYGS